MTQAQAGAMRVLHIGKFFPPYRGGMEIFLSDLIAAQRAAGIDAHALVHGAPEPGDPPWLARVPVQWQLVYAPIAIGFRAALAEAIRRVRPHALHLHMPNNSALWVLTLPEARELPWIVHWHADVVDSHIRLAVALAYRAYRPFEQAVLERAERIIATSPPYLDASEPLRRWRDKCAVIPLGADTAQFPPADPAPAHHAWTPGKLRLLSIGRLTYYKGFETLVRAVCQLDHAELLIVGEGELRAPLQALIARHSPAGEAPRVRLLGDVPDAHKHALLRDCELFCLSSRERTEAFGIVLLEAMSHARPCLVSELQGSGMPWVVSQAGAGECVPVDDVPAWSAAITRLGEDPARRRQLGESGQRALRARFSMRACADGIAAQYRRLTNHAHQSAINAGARRGVLVVIPAHNEAQTIGAVIRGLRRAGWHDVLVIDDQSSDGTGAAAESAGARVLRPALRVGAWGGMQTGIRHGLAQGYEAVVTMDADGQHEVSEIPRLLAARASADLVIGAYPERASALRHLAWRWFRQLARFELQDLTSGFRLYNRRAMAILAAREATLLDYQDLGALLLVRRAGLHIEEVPVAMNERMAGKSRIFHSWASVAKYMAATTLLCLARWPTGRSGR